MIVSYRRPFFNTGALRRIPEHAMIPGKGAWIPMLIPIRVDSMKAAEALSNVCKQFPQEIFLRSHVYCIDPKSTLGILAMMYSARDGMTLDTADMPDADAEKLRAALQDFVIG